MWRKSTHNTEEIDANDGMAFLSSCCCRCSVLCCKPNDIGSEDSLRPICDHQCLFGLFWYQYETSPEVVQKKEDPVQCTECRGKPKHTTPCSRKVMQLTLDCYDEFIIFVYFCNKNQEVFFLHHTNFYCMDFQFHLHLQDISAHCNKQQFFYNNHQD